jgi:hypothetical protein
MLNFRRPVSQEFPVRHDANHFVQLVGIKTVFDNQQPTNEQVIEIHNVINTPEHFNALTSNDGLKTGDVTLRMPDGRDCISWEEFDPDEQTEWCLLNQGENIYNLITATNAESYISTRQKHPYLSRELMAGDIIRGQAVLDLFHGLEVVIDELPPDPEMLAFINENRIDGIITTGFSISMLALSLFYLANSTCSSSNATIGTMLSGYEDCTKNANLNFTAGMFIIPFSIVGIYAGFNQLLRA